MILGTVTQAGMWVGLVCISALIITLQVCRAINSERVRQRVLDDMQRRHNNNMLRLNDPRDK